MGKRRNLCCTCILRCYFITKKNFLYFSIGSDLLREQLEEPLKKFDIQYKRLSTIVIR